jgi:myo-inositol-1-phosphate synthase
MHRTDGTAEGKLAVLMPGLGAVATTFIAGVELIRRRQALVAGSWTQLAMLNGRRVQDLIPFAPLHGLAFGTWDVHGEDAFTVALRSDVLSGSDLSQVRTTLSQLRPKPGVFDPAYVKRLAAPHASRATHHRDRIAALREDIRAFKRELNATRAVMVFTASTEAYQEPVDFAHSRELLERALSANDRRVTPTMLYAYAAILEGVPFANGTPNLAVDLPAMQQLARERGVPVCGRDLKSGQTMLKTAIAPALRARLLGLRGWFSTNILGNRDGEVLDDPASFRAKEVTKGSVLETLLPREDYPALYGDIAHKVTIHYYPPRGDSKEGWDNIDLFGWLGYPMQLKVNFLCRDSILAAPLVLDLALLLDAAQRAGRRGTQDWLGFFFKCPMALEARPPLHHLFEQEQVLQREVLTLAEELATGSWNAPLAPAGGL